MDDEPNAAEPPKPRRRWFQFRLRTVLIGVALLAILCGYIAHVAGFIGERAAWRRTHSNFFAAGEFIDIRVLANCNPLEKPSLIRRWMGDSSCDFFPLRVNTPLLTGKSEHRPATMLLSALCGIDLLLFVIAE